MIYILHGSDSNASYSKLNSITSTRPAWQKIYTKTEDELIENLFTDDLISSDKIIIAEFLPDLKKINTVDLSSIAKNRILIIWEKQEITASKLKPFQKLAQIENFKLPTALFTFLDSISPNHLSYLKTLKKLDDEQVPLNWHIANRLTQLILAKLSYTQTDASEILGKNIAPWQWQKIKNQAQNFALHQLKNLSTSTLRIDYLTKSGKTQIPQQVLLTLMFTKLARKPTGV